MKGLILIIIGGFFGGCVKWLLNKNIKLDIKLVEQCVISILVAFVVPSLLYIIDKNLLISVLSSSTINKNDFIFFGLCVLIGSLANIGKGGDKSK